MEIYIASGDEKTNAAHLISIDPDTEFVTDYGSVGPANNGTVKTERVCADDTYIYAISGQVPFNLVGIKNSTGETKTYATSAQRIGLTQSEFGCFYFKDGLMYFLYENKSILASDGVFGTPPWPILSTRDGENTLFPTRTIVDLPEKPEVVTENARVDASGHAQLWVKWNSVWKSYSYGVQRYAQSISRIFTMANGRIFGTGSSYSGNFIYDPVSNTSTYLGTLNQSHAATAEYDGKLYMSGYPSGITYVYDPKKAWTQNSNNWSLGKDVLAFSDASLNPQYIGYMRETSGIHAAKSMAVGSDGFIYIGGEWRRDGKGGGLSWYNPKSGAVDGISAPFGNYQIHNITTTKNGKYIVISTKAVEDIILNKPAPMYGKIFVFDTETKTIVNAYTPLNTTISTGDIIGTDGPYILGVSTNATNDKVYIYRLNVETGRIDYQATHNHNSVFRVGVEYIGGRLVAIDPFSGDIAVKARLSADGVESGSGQYGGLSFVNSDLYLSSADKTIHSLRRVKNIAE